MKLRLLIVLACLFTISLQKSTINDDHYVAAVVEYKISGNVTQNLQNFMKYIERAHAQGADIVVFPEMTLTGLTTVAVPLYTLLTKCAVPSDCPDLFDKILVTISNAARENDIYVVVNVREGLDCRQQADTTDEYCPEDKLYVFNTNVVFDRRGAVIDRYRKINLFQEPSHTSSLQRELGLFTTDFGVTFGHFICFDLLFETPALRVINELKVTDIIFPTMWFSQLPHLTAVQIQQAFAHSMNVNLLAAGANNVALGSAGSGIYSGKAGTLVSLMTQNPINGLLVAKVPRVPGKIKENSAVHTSYETSSGVGAKLLVTVDPTLESYVTRTLTPGFQEFTLVDNEVSCNFRVDLGSKNSGSGLTYMAVARDGTVSISSKELGVTACSVLACKTDDIKTCGHRYKTNQGQTIYQLDIAMKTHRSSSNSTYRHVVAYFPVSANNNYLPIQPSEYIYDEIVKENYEGTTPKARKHSRNKNKILQSNQENVERIIYKLNNPQSDLISFGIWGRIYSKDDRNNFYEKGSLDVLDIIFNSDEIERYGEQLTQS